MTCFAWLILVVGAVFLLLSLIRWFEQITEAVQNRWWNKTVLLIVFPFAVWFYPSRIAAGRPTPVPLHEPVRGFGSVPKARTAPGSQTAPSTTPSSDQPPPGTPPEFLVKPKVPPKKPGTKPAIDPDKIAKLKQKMREQGMLGDDQ